MRNLRKARRAVAGFFEEIPAAAVVIVALTLFTAALVADLQAHNQEVGDSNFAAEAETFLEDLVDYKNLTYQGQPGVFEAAKVITLTAFNITYDFHPPFQYNVTILDVSNYTAHYNGHVETHPLPTTTAGLRYGIVHDETSVTIWVPELGFDEYHAAILSVVIWE